MKIATSMLKDTKSPGNSDLTHPMKPNPLKPWFPDTEKDSRAEKTPRQRDDFD